MTKEAAASRLTEKHMKRMGKKEPSSLPSRKTTSHHPRTPDTDVSEQMDITWRDGGEDN